MWVEKGDFASYVHPQGPRQAPSSIDSSKVRISVLNRCSLNTLATSAPGETMTHERGNVIPLKAKQSLASIRLPCEAGWHRARAPGEYRSCLGLRFLPGLPGILGSGKEPQHPPK